MSNGSIDPWCMTFGQIMIAIEEGTRVIEQIWGGQQDEKRPWKQANGDGTFRIRDDWSIQRPRVKTHVRIP